MVAGYERVSSLSTRATALEARHPESTSDPLTLARRLLNHQDLSSMVRTFGRETGAFVAVEHPRGTTGGDAPAGTPRRPR